MTYTRNLDNTLVLQPECRIRFIGESFEKLGRALLGGESNPDTRDSLGDLHLSDLDAFVEIKGASNRDAFTIFLKQLEKQREQLGFPFSHCWYLLMSYQNHPTKEKKVRGRKRDYPGQRILTNKTLTEEKLLSFLVQQTDIACLIDSAILQRISEHDAGKHRLRLRHNLKRPAISIGRRYIHDLATNGALAELGYRPRAFGIRDWRIQPPPPFESMAFRLVVVLPHKQLAQVEAILRERCIII